MFGGTFAPNGWMTCDGQLLAISEFETLFNLIGTTYGGDGQSTFALPNLSGRLPAHQGTNAGTTYTIGQPGGSPTVGLNSNQIPSHNHPVVGATAGGVTSPANAYPGTAVGGPSPLLYGNTAPNATINSGTLLSQGGSQPHDNLQPYLAVTFIISLFGVFPSQN